MLYHKYIATTQKIRKISETFLILTFTLKIINPVSHKTRISHNTKHSILGQGYLRTNHCINAWTQSAWTRRCLVAAEASAHSVIQSALLENPHEAAAAPVACAPFQSTSHEYVLIRHSAKSQNFWQWPSVAYSPLWWVNDFQVSSLSISCD